MEKPPFAIQTLVDRLIIFWFLIGIGFLLFGILLIAIQVSAWLKEGLWIPISLGKLLIDFGIPLVWEGRQLLISMLPSC
jgi:uncharacterized membrane protein HdeD (DUF308 family)